jgi:hypothetical protein
VAGALIDNIQRDAAWQTVFPVLIAIASLSFVLTCLEVVQQRDAVALSHSSGLLNIAVSVFDFLVGSGSMVCFQLSLYYGPFRSWSSPLVICLLVAGCGGCLILWIISHRGRTNRQHLDVKQWLTLVFLMLWGASYYSFGLFLRELIDIHNRS